VNRLLADDFRSFEWSPCEGKLLYIAEKKVPKAEPFYKPKAQDSKETGNEDRKAIKVRSHNLL
jgi:acylaminoacyl-peptidase